MRQHPVKVSNYYPLVVIPNQVTSGEPPPRLGGHPRLSSHAPCLHTAGNGPGGIRTRTCDLDGVLCSLYTTGPQDRSVMLMS